MKSKIISSFFFNCFPFLKYRVIGHSMESEYLPGTVVFAFRWFTNLQVSNIVILKDPRDKQLVMKRISRINNTKIYVLGDNERESTDSRTFGWIDRKLVIAKVIMKL